MIYVIFNFERWMFWRSNERGYTRDLSEAGLYSLERAQRICEKANFQTSPRAVEEAMIPITGLAIVFGEGAQQ